MRTQEIRHRFFDFFGSRDHLRVPSGSLIPGDPTLLLTNAGMVPFKPYYMGEQTPEHRRLMSLQKCVRTVDIENIGRTRRHATFFEMLGNFSFGDYFKAETVAWAWELMTEGYGLPADRLWVTVYREDDEAYELWRRIGVPAPRIQRLGRADNYWALPVPGPCGPDSEIFFDRGPEYGREGGPAVDSERYVELWNLVFMEFLRGESDSGESDSGESDSGDEDDFPIVGVLPQPSIDTGLGVDRLAMVLQGVDSVFDTDGFVPVLRALSAAAGRQYVGAPADQRVSFRIVGDHVRAATFLVADGVLPGNEGRGYVLRRLLRRAVRHARLLGVDGPVLSGLSGTVVDSFGETWPDLVAQRALIAEVTAREEEAFGRTLRQGSRLLESAIGRTRERRDQVLPGSTAFELHDTFGFPVDLTVEIAEEAGLRVDRERFGLLMEEQRRRAKAARGELSPGPRQDPGPRNDEVYRELANRFGPTTFVGYEDLTIRSSVLAVLGDNDKVEVILDRSPLYAESGGQVGDTGEIVTDDGAVLRVVDTRYGVDGLTVHTVEVHSGQIEPGQEVTVRVDGERRAATARSHSATHILHALLRQELGDHARQHGSLVEPGRLRFDFTHFDALHPERLARIEDEVNQRVLADPEVRVWHASRGEAEAAGATALFGEKYGETVRVVDIGDFSRELCGGTHVHSGAGTGPVRILGESSIGSGLRRIEALTGIDALRHANHERVVLRELGQLLGGRPDALVAQLSARLSALADAERRLAGYRDGELDSVVDSLLGKRRPIGRGWLVVEAVDGLTVAELRSVANRLRGKAGPGQPVGVVLGAAVDGKAHLVAVLNQAFANQPEGPDGGGSVEAVELLREAGQRIGGGAGGTGLTANAGGRRADKLGEALRVAAVHATRLAPTATD
jgi:alanyl-tRNA synthetase